MLNLYAHLGAVTSRPPSGRVRKNYRLDPELIARAKAILGTKTETETIEQALDMIAFQKEVQDGIRAGAGKRIWVDVFGEYPEA